MQKKEIREMEMLRIRYKIGKLDMRGIPPKLPQDNRAIQEPDSLIKSAGTEEYK